MVKFVAKQPTSNVALGGIVYLSAPAGLRFDDIEHKSFTASNDLIRLEIRGKGFENGFGRPKAEGTVTDIKFYLQGTFIYKLSGAKYPLHDLADSNDKEKHTKKIFAKSDVILGSFGTDILEGFKGSDRIDGKGGNDVLSGDGGKDTLIGGEGGDRLDGGKGKDTYIFNADPITGLDRIIAFQKNEQIGLKAKVFGGLEVGELLPEQFVIAGSGEGPDYRIIYNSDNGGLIYDADGAGPLAPVAFAVLPTGIDHIGADNFFVF